MMDKISFKNIFLLVLFAFNTTWASANLCIKSYKKTQESNKTLEWLEKLAVLEKRDEVLKKAKELGFEIKTLRGTVAGKRVEFVLFGETHINNEERFKAAESVRQYFPNRALEGFDARSYWFPKLMEIASNEMTSGYKAEAQRKELKGSTIEASVHEEIFERLLGEALTLSEQDRQTYIENLPNMIFKYRENSTAARLKDLLGDEHVVQLQQKLFVAKGITPKNITNINLETTEYKHKPSFTEQMVALQVGLSALATKSMGKNWDKMLWVTCGLSACSSFASNFPITPEVMRTVSYVGFSTLIYKNLYLPLGLSLRMLNNDFMVKNLIAGVQQEGVEDAVLVMVGSAHIKGMTKILQEKYNFR